MRVAFVDQAGDTPGGAQRSLAILLRALPAGVEPHALLFSDGAFAASLRGYGIPVSIVPLPAALLSTTRERPGAGLAALPRAIAETARVLRTIGADVVHTNTVKAHAVAAPAARLAGTHCVAHLRDILGGRSRTAIRSVLALCSSERIAISRAVRSAFALGATCVIPNPLMLDDYRALPERDAARRALGIPADGTLVSLIGRINRWKGHDRLIRIAALLRANGAARYAIVGAPLFRDADFVGELHALVAREGLSGRVQFVPWLDDARTAFAATDINVNCSDDEPFGRTIIEAAACGVPSIAFDGGGTADAIVDGRTGRLVPRGDENAFARALGEYLSDGAARRTAGIAAREFAQTFDAPTHAARVAGVLRRAAS
jgi:glycosyltransferase involved in cell wall biosynthesis